MSSRERDNMIQNSLSELKRKAKIHHAVDVYYMRRNRFLEFPTMIVLTFLTTSISVEVFSTEDTTMKWIEMALSSVVIFITILLH